MIPLEECDFVCNGCGLITCMELHPSPAEPDQCADCFQTEEDEHDIEEGRLRARDYEKWADL